MKYLLIALLFLVSCSDNEKKAPEEPLIGTWVYDHTELNNGQPINLQDSLYRGLHEQQIGLTFSFSEDSTFRVSQKEAGGNEKKIAEQPYVFTADKKEVILKNTGRPDDKFPVIHLSDSLLKINIFYSTEAYMVFRKQNSK